MAFWILATILSLIAIVAILPTLLGKRSIQLETVRERNIAIAKERKAEITSLLESLEISQEEHDASLRDLEASLTADLDEVAPADQTTKASKPLAISIAILLPLLATGLYFATGHSGVPDTSVQNTTATTSPAAIPNLAELISGLEKKVAQNPDDARGHFLLAETYKRLQRYGDAVKAYKDVRRLQEDNPAMLSSYADAIVMDNNGEFTTVSENLLDQALKLDPNHINSLWLGGMAKQAFGKAREARIYWQRLKPLLANSPQDLVELQIMLDDLDHIPNNSDSAIEPTPPINVTPAPSNTAGLTVEVSLDLNLNADINPTDLVFVFARAESGPPMPLAAVRKTVADLPFKVRLDDSMAMMPQMSLSKFSKVIVSARISKSGQATAQKGDIQSASLSTENNRAAPIKLTLSNILP